jgi:uridylate kinase
MQETVIISLGGSLFAPKEGQIDTNFLKTFSKFVSAQVNIGKKIFIIAGGGRPARLYQRALNDLITPTPTDLDWIGIYTTHLNAQLIRMSFQDLAYPHILTDPTILDKEIHNYPIVIAGGWHPGNSTDLVAVKLAETVGAKKVVNLSNIDYVYSADPNTHPDAKILTSLDWKSFLDIVGTTWDPGASAPFDPIASQLAHQLNLEVAILNGKDIQNIQNYLSEKPFKGSVIK